MADEYIFQPDRRLGIVFHLAALLFLGFIGLFGLWQASLADIGPAFLLYLLPALGAIVILPALAYRLFALRSAVYSLEREGVHLKWGLRVEDIPIANVTGVYLAAEQNWPVPLPRLRWPGAVLGHRRLPGGENIEFLAADVRKLVLIATPGRVYAISPANPQAFLFAFQRCTELGSLSPIASRSVYPTLILSQVWQSAPARFLLLVGLIFSLVLLIWVSLAIPGRSQVILGARPGVTGDAAPAVRLLLLPVINSVFFLMNFFLGLYFYRRSESQVFSHLLWMSSAATAFLFLMAVFFILRMG